MQLWCVMRPTATLRAQLSVIADTARPAPALLSAWMSTLKIPKSKSPHRNYRTIPSWTMQSANFTIASVQTVERTSFGVSRCGLAGRELRLGLLIHYLSGLKPMRLYKFSLARKLPSWTCPSPTLMKLPLTTPPFNQTSLGCPSRMSSLWSPKKCCMWRRSLQIGFSPISLNNFHRHMPGLDTNPSKPIFNSRKITDGLPCFIGFVGKSFYNFYYINISIL